MNLSEEDIRRIIQEEIKSSSTKFGVAQVGYHYHTGADSSQLPYVQQTSSGANGVFSPGNIGSSIVNKNPATNISPSGNQIVPLPVINATSGSFNGGAAPIGTAILFINNTTRQIWFRFYSDANGAFEWYGIDFSPGHTNSAATVIGPVAG